MTELILADTMWWVFAIIVTVSLIRGIEMIFWPYNFVKKIAAGKIKIHDNVSRFSGVFRLVFFGGVLLWLLGYLNG